MEEITAEIDARAVVNEPRPSRETRAPGLSVGLLAPFSSTLVRAAVRRFSKMRNSKVFSFLQREYFPNGNYAD